MITRRSLALAGGIAPLVVHCLGHGQTATAIRRVGILGLASEAAVAGLIAAFKQAMHDLGWLEGKDVEYRRLSAEGDVNRLDALARELVAQRADVIVAGNPAATQALQRATKSIPIVMTIVADPVGRGFVASLARPGGNITGLSTQSDEVMGKLIETLHEIAPLARRIAIVSNENNPSHAANRASARSACAALGLDAVWVVANAPAQLAGAAVQIVDQRSQAVVVVGDAIFFNERVKLQALLQTTGLPVAYGSREHVLAGGLLSYSADFAAIFRDAAKYVDKLLKGARPADLPVAQPTKFELVINLKTAKTLGLTIPQSVLLRADMVIE